MAKADYPLLLVPHLAERVWGGDLLGPGIGEAWDLSVHPHGPSRVANGALRNRTLPELPEADFGGPIDLLAKRLDCRQDLSVQVHPTDPATAKTESWVVLQADRGAGVYHGFRRPVTREEVAAAAADGSLKGILQYVTEPLVSIDFRGNPHSSILDATYTSVMDGDFVKVLSWYDNEWGYSNRCVDLLRPMVQKGL